MEAVWVWNSHAFNVTEEATYNQQWLNVYFAPSEDRTFPIAASTPTTSSPGTCRFEERGTVARYVRRRHAALRLSSHTPPARGSSARGVRGSAAAGDRQPQRHLRDDAPISVTTQYNDPTQLRFSRRWRRHRSRRRTFKFCALRQRLQRPERRERNSQSPLTVGRRLAPGVRVVTGFVDRDLGISCLNR
jgi:hypothetical protein